MQKISKKIDDLYDFIVEIFWKKKKTSIMWHFDVLFIFLLLPKQQRTQLFLLPSQNISFYNMVCKFLISKKRLHKKL